jgi:hypothetical protein
VLELSCDSPVASAHHDYIGQTVYLASSHKPLVITAVYLDANNRFAGVEAKAGIAVGATHHFAADQLIPAYRGDMVYSFVGIGVSAAPIPAHRRISYTPVIGCSSERLSPQLRVASR